MKNALGTVLSQWKECYKYIQCFRKYNLFFILFLLLKSDYYSELIFASQNFPIL